MKIALDYIGKPSAGRFTFMNLLNKYLLDNGDEIVNVKNLKNSDVYLTHGFDLTEKKIKEVANVNVRLVVRQDGWAPINYDKMIKGDTHFLKWLKLLASVDRVIYQSEFCVEMFKRFNHDISNGVVIHNGVIIPKRKTKKKNILIIYTTKSISCWWEKLITPTIKYVKKWCIENNIQCIEVKKHFSHLPHAKLLNLFAESKYVMHLYPFAPCANTLLEAMAGGNIVISFDSGGDPELTLEDLLIPLNCSRFDFPSRDIEVSEEDVLVILNKTRDNYDYYKDLTQKRILQFDYRLIGQKYRNICMEMIK